MYLIAAVLNLLFDFILVKPLGISGLYIATIICRGIIFITDIFVVYHFGFQKSMNSYLAMAFKWLMLTFIVCLISFFCFRFVPVCGVFGFVIKVILVTLIYGVVFWLVYRRSEDYFYFKGLMRKVLSKVVKKR